MMNSLIDDHELSKQEPDLERLRHAHALLSTNVPQALTELEALAERGSITSMLYLAHAYVRGGNPDIARAEEWYRSAYEKGSSSALYNLGSFYYKKGDFFEAEKIFLDGYSKKDAPSMYWLATIYLVDPKHRDKFNQAKDLLENAIVLGNVSAKHGLGLLMMKGRYGLKNFPRGLWLFLGGMVDAFMVTCRDPSSRRLW